MEAADAEADLPVCFEAAARGQEAEVGRFERVGGRERDAAVVEARGVGRGCGWARQCEVPFVEVGVGEGGRMEGWVGVCAGGGQLGGFFEEASDGGRGRHCRRLGGAPERLQLLGRAVELSA